METVLEIIVAVLAAFGLGMAAWLLFGRMVTPIGVRGGAPAAAVVRARGDGAGLEQTVDGLLWLSRSGWPALRIILADDGLTETGRQRALHLTERAPGVRYCPPGTPAEDIFD